MPQKNKVAKKRLDKFYYLAKERGYRSRAAFKLLQLDKKYEFLAKAKGVLDLCAAPGSWMQVARQHIPADSPCIGIDLAAIKPIHKCVALQEDITTAKCRAAIKQEIGGHKIDVVLHDGAPNVGTAWLQDAFGQNELTIHALRLATDFMVPGGTFVTKAFRSQDYNALLFVFNQLFRRVEATKPQASRNESAEIFVVCTGFTNAKIDPKFLDPKFVFKELDLTDQAQTNVLQMKKGAKAKAEGYAHGTQLLTKALPIVAFVEGGAPVKALGDYNQLTWEESSPQCAFWAELPITTAAVREACSDLKLLGKREFRMLLAWRLKAAEAWRKHQAGESKQAADGEGGESGDEDGGDTAEGADERLDEEIGELERMSLQRKKAAKRKEAEKRRRMKERLSLKMEHPGDRLDVAEEFELFSLDKIRSAAGLQAVANDVAADELADDDEEDPHGGGGGDDDDDEAGDYLDKLDAELNAMYADYQSRVQRRAVAEIEVAQSEAPLSKKGRQRELRRAEDAADEDPEDEARRVAAAAFRAVDEEDLATGGGAGLDDDDDDDDDDGGGGELHPADRVGGGGYGRRSLDDDGAPPSRSRKGGSNPLIVDIERGTRAERAAADGAATSSWFGQDLFAGLDAEEDDEEEVAAMAEAARRKRDKEHDKGKKARGSDGTKAHEHTSTDEAHAAAAAVSGKRRAASAPRSMGASDEEASAAEEEEPAPSKKKAKGAAARAAAAASSAAAAVSAAVSTVATAAVSSAAAAFIRAAKFGGARLGYVFKRGAQGVGYYLDSQLDAQQRLLQQKQQKQRSARAGSGSATGSLPAAAGGGSVAPLAQPLKKSAKRQKREQAEQQAAAEAAAEAAASFTSAGGDGNGDGSKRKRNRDGKSSTMPVVPDDARFEDLVPEGGERVVGGKAAARRMNEDEEELTAAMSQAESAQAALARQAEAIVLGQLLLHPQKRRALEDAAYNRHTRNDPAGLPQWFLDDERKYAQPSGYGVELDEKALRKAQGSLKDITARTIGKVAEAKARKQRRMQRALTKIKKKAEAVAAKEDLSEREKSREIEKMYQKKLGGKSEKDKKVLVVGRKFQGGSGGKTPHNVKLVDKRSKSDARGEKRAAKNSKGSRGKHGGPGGGGRKGSRQKKSKQYNRGGRK